MKYNDAYHVWHPLKQENEGEKLKTIVSGQGIYVYDDKGKKYIDCESGLWNVCLGYKNKEINAAIIKQLNNISYINPCEYSNDTVVKLADKIIDITPETFNSIFFTCTGSESVELSIKYARKYQGIKGNFNKNKIGVFNASYHGSYYGSMSASQLENDFKVGYGPLVEGFISFSIPFSRNCKIDQLGKADLKEFLSELEEKFQTHRDELAAFIFEPILGSAGVIPLPLEYVKLVKELCDRYDVLLISDEVATGFGRTGTMFAFQHYNITPDIICLSKCMNSGYLPIGGVVVSDKIKDLFNSNKSFIFHLCTQNCNPVGCASSLAALDVITKEDYVKKSELKGKILKEKLENNLKENNLVFDIRGKGLMLAIDLVNSKTTNELISKEKLTNIVNIIRDKGVILGYFYNYGFSAGLDMFPPFIISDREIDKVSNIVSRVLNRMG